MQIHGPSIETSEARVDLNPGNGSPFVSMRFGGADEIHFYISTVADADVLIAAATEAKRLLTEAEPDRAARVPLDVIEDEPEQQRDGEA